MAHDISKSLQVIATLVEVVELVAELKDKSGLGLVLELRRIAEVVSDASKALEDIKSIGDELKDLDVEEMKVLAGACIDALSKAISVLVPPKAAVPELKAS